MTQEHVACTQLSGRRESAADARAFVTAAVKSWGIDRPIDDVLLVVSELVTNAILHTESRQLEVTVEQTSTAIRVEVTDASPSAPTPRAAASDDTNGRGLLLVDAVAAEWGVERRSDGKHVWAEVG